MGDSPTVTPTTPGAARAIDARLDIQQALKAARASRDQSRLVLTLLADPLQNCADAGRCLGWSLSFTQRVTRSLKSDRPVGRKLQSRLAPYAKNKNRPRAKKNA